MVNLHLGPCLKPCSLTTSTTDNHTTTETVAATALAAPANMHKQDPNDRAVWVLELETRTHLEPQVCFFKISDNYYLQEDINPPPPPSYHPTTAQKEPE